MDKAKIKRINVELDDFLLWHNNPRLIEEFGEERPIEAIESAQEEITDRFGRYPVHLCAANVKQLIPPMGGDSVAEPGSGAEPPRVVRVAEHVSVAGQIIARRRASIAATFSGLCEPGWAARAPR